MPRESDSLYNTVMAELRQLGVRLPRKSKKKKEHQSSGFNSSLVGNIFGQPLVEQDWLSDPPVPRFVNQCTSYLLRCSNVEGLLRKSGSITRQKDLVNHLEKGHPIKWEELDPHDVGAILKQWLRALPQPVIPSRVAELLVAGLRVEEHSRAMCLALLLLPPENLYLLRHLAAFLKDLTRDTARSRMDAKNLAVVMAPNLFPPATVMLQDFIAVTEALILISSELSSLPQTLADCLPSRRTRKPSGTFTDLFNGFKKFVVKTPGGSLTTPSAAATTPSQACKRRANGSAVTPCSSRLRPLTTIATPLTNPTPSQYKGSPHPNSALRIRRVQKEVKQSLRRGRPNTVQSGLPRPLSLPADSVAQKLQFFSYTDDSSSICQGCVTEDELETTAATMPTSYSDSSLLVSDSIALSETLSHSKSDYVYLTPCSKDSNPISYDSSGLNDEDTTITITRQDSLVREAEVEPAEQESEDGEPQQLTHSSSASSYSPYPPPLCNELKFEQLLDEEKHTSPEKEEPSATQMDPQANNPSTPPLMEVEQSAEGASPKVEKKRRKLSMEPTKSTATVTPPSQTNNHQEPEETIIWTPSKQYIFDQPTQSSENDTPSAAKRESIAQILAKNAGKVKANVQKFNNITTRASINTTSLETTENIFKTPAPAPRRRKPQATVLTDKTNQDLSVNV